MLRDNNYPLRFIRSCKSYHSAPRRDSNTNDASSASAPSTSTFVVLPYVRGVSERISRVLRNNGVKVSCKPCNVLRTRFPRPKDKPFAFQCRGVVYKVGCVDCNFVYYGETDRALETRLKEHKQAVRVGDNNFKIAQNANQFVHDIDFDHTTIVDKARNFHKRLFLEAWYSQSDNHADVYLGCPRMSRGCLSRMSTKPSCKHARLPFVAFCWRSTRRTVNRYKAVIQLAFKNSRLRPRLFGRNVFDA